MTRDKRSLRLLSLGIVAAVGVAACGGPSGSSSPKQGGKLVAASWQEPDSLLGAGITDSGTHFFADVNPVMEGLLSAKAPADVSSNPGFTDYWEPQLATEVPTVENGDVKVNGSKMDVTWKLRHNVKWHDGEAFTSKDVKATFDFWFLKYKDKNPTPVLSTQGWDRVESVDTPDDYTAVVHWKQVFGPYLAFGTGPYGIIAAHLLQKTWDKGGDMTKVKLDYDLSAVGGYKGTDTWDNVMVGTGPFVFKEWVKGDHITLVRNPNWWGSHQAYLDSITIKFEPDTNTELADLRTNTIDFGWDFRGALIAPLSHIQNVTTLTLPDSGAEKLDLNVKNPLLADPAVRKAILLGIDRQTIVDTLLTGKSVVPTDSWLCLPNSTGAWCHDDNNKATKYDVEAAKKVLADAGYTKKVTVHLPSGDKTAMSKDGKTPLAFDMVTTSGNALREQQEVVIANNLGQIGIVIKTPFNNPKAGKLFGAYASGGILYNHTFDIALYTNTYGSPGEPDTLGYPAYRCDQIPSASNGGQGQNSTQICDKDLDAALEKGRSGSLKQTDRKQAYVDAQEILLKLLPEIPLYQQVTVMAFNNKMHGYKGNDFFWMNNMQDVYVS